MLNSRGVAALRDACQHKCGCGQTLVFNPRLAPARHRAFTVVKAAKRAKGNKSAPSKSGGGKGQGKPSGNGGHPNYKSAGDVREGGAYTQETRDVILSLDRATKTAPNGKQILKNVGVAMYLGAKIGNGGLQFQRIYFQISWNATQAEKRAVDQSRTSASSLARTSADTSLHNYLVLPLGGHLDFTSDFISISAV